jgi:glycosyltransferase involved in cell wall biosynthesis
MKPRVLFVSRERHRLPLTGPQRRKWDALAEVCEYRVLAAAPEGWPTSDERFRLVAPASPRILDGALFYALLPARIAQELRRFRPDAAFVQGVHEMDALLVARRAARVPTRAILDVQGDWHEATRLYGSSLRRLLNPLNDALAPAAVRGADVVRTVSEQTTGLVRELGVEPGGVFPAYVDAEAFLERPPAPLPERPTALFVGVLERYKSFDTLAEAWRRAAPRVPDATLHVVGAGTLAPLAERLVAEVPGTRWTRQLSPEQVAAALDESWLLALPSRSEGLPRVAVEAVSRGRAVIGGRAGGIPDVVEHERNGLLVDPDSAEELAKALVRILSDRPLAEQLCGEARRTGEAWSVTPEEYAAKVEALVRLALAR